MTLSIVVLVSGNGTNLQALLDAIGRGELPARIRAVIGSKRDAFALQRARHAGISAHAVAGDEYPDRSAYDAALTEVIERYDPGLIALAGFMRILTDAFVRRFAGKMLNIHPSLLPKYRGLHTHRRVLEAGDAEHGASVHFVTEELDGGPVVLQAKIPVLKDDTEASLARRVQQREHLIYPLAIRWFAEGRLRLADGTVMLDDAVLDSPKVLE